VNENQRLLRLTTTASVLTAVLLMAAKLVAWLLSDAVSVLSSLVDSTMDALAAGVTFVAIRFAMQPADAEHRFGHGKAEPLAALAQATFIAGSAMFLLLQGAERLIHPQSLKYLEVSLVVMAASTVITVLLLSLQRHTIRKTGSTAIRADALHYATDLLTNLGIIAALLLNRLGFQVFDPLIGLLIAIYILYSAARIGYAAVQLLLDHELPDDIRQRIIHIACAHPDIHGVHELRTRQSGATQYVQIHLDMNGALPLRRAHDIGEEVEALLCRAFPEMDVIIHHDPAPESTR